MGAGGTKRLYRSLTRAQSTVVSGQAIECPKTPGYMMIGVDMRRSLQAAFFAILLVASMCPVMSADEGYDLWMSCRKLDDATMIREYRQALSSIVIQGRSDTLDIVREEVKRGVEGLLGVDPPIRRTLTARGGLSSARRNSPNSYSN